MVDAVVFGSGAARGSHYIHALAMYVSGQAHPNKARLRTHAGSGELSIQFVEHYDIVFHPDALLGALYDVQTSYYQYLILDRLEQEIVAYHWEPESKSLVVRPHVHVSAAAPIVLPQPSGSPLAETKTHLSKLHLPTGRVGIEDIVELLITDFAVTTLRPDWQTVLLQAREYGSRR